MSKEYYGRKKSGIGKIIGLIILVIVLGAGAYCYFWFSGLSKMPKEIENAKITQTPEMSGFYEKNILKKSTAPIELDEAQSKYVFSRLFNETNFFHLPAGTPVKINSFVMSPSGNNMNLAMAFNIGSGSALLLPSFEKIVFGAQTVYAADPFTFFSGKQYGVTATLSLKALKEGIGLRPISVLVGTSPMPVATAMGFAKQYAPQMQVTNDGYIVLKPTTIIDAKTNKVIGTLSSLEVKDGKSYITIK